MKTIVQLIMNATAAGKAWLLAADAAAQKVLLGLTKSDVGLSNVDNTSDANKPVSSAQASAIAAKIGGSVGATDNRLVRSDGTGTLTVQATGITVDDSNNVSGVGTITASGQITGTSFRVASGFVEQYSGATRVVAAGTIFTSIDSGRLDLNSGNVGQIRLGGTGASAVSVRNSGTTLRSRLADDSADADFTAKAITASGLIGLGVYTVATLPSAAANAGRIAQVTDSSVTANGSAVSGGGANRVMVFSNGTTWDVVVA